MQFGETTPFRFACMACNIAGFKLPSRGLPDDERAGFLMRFEAVSDVDISLAYEAETSEFLIAASLSSPKRRSPEDVSARALKANHLRREGDPCFAMDPVTSALTLTQTVIAPNLDLADLAIDLTAVTILAMKWRALMDELPDERAPMDNKAMLRV
jgi:hypothetical protein